MTVTYSLNVANAKLTGFSKLLLRWKGSIYKLLYREMAIFVTMYYSLSFVYRYLLSARHRIVFEKIALYCETFTNMVPLTFVLGFYVSIVVTRWWQQFMQIPWPDKVVMLVAGNVHGSDERGRMIRRTLARYLLLLMTLTCQAVSTSVRKRFPTLDHIEEAGIMSKEERIVFDKIPGTHGKYWAPTVWFTNLVIRARKEGRIKDDILLKQLLDELHVYRSCCGMMFSYDWISIPLVYTQTVTIATYAYFLATIMGRQYLDPTKGYNNHDVDLYVPVFTIFEFFFFMGWLKVAEQLINPYGEDDDDFELNWCLDRNLLVSFTVVDDMYGKHPRLVKDMYWDDSEPVLPYTKQSFGFRSQPYLGSALDLNIDLNEAEFLPLETIMEEDNDRTYKSPPNSPSANGDLISIGTVAENQVGSADTTSQAGLRFAIDSVRGSLRGSRFLNMIIGQSTENVAKTPSRSESVKANHPLLPTFSLKTPPLKKRSRTTSVSESTRTGIYPANSSINMDIPNIQGGGVTVPAHYSKNNLTVSYDDITSAPVMIGASRTPTRYGTPSVERRSFRSERLDSKDSQVSQDTTGSGIGSYPGNEGFRFPPTYMSGPSIQQQQQFFANLIPQQSAAKDTDPAIEVDIDTDEEVEIKTPEIMTPVLPHAPSLRSNSRLDSESNSNALFDATVEELVDSPEENNYGIPSTAMAQAMASTSTTDNDPPVVTERKLSNASTHLSVGPMEPIKEKEESPFEPALSDESLPSYDDSNQSTVRSITELIKQDKDHKGKSKDRKDTNP